MPIAVDQGVGIMVWSPLAGGLLSGKYRRGQPHPPGSRHLTDWGEPPIRDEGRLYDIVEELVAIAAERGVTPAAVALAWLLGRPGVATLVIGARSEAQLAANLAAAELELIGRGLRPPGAGQRACRCSTPTGTRPRPPADRLGPADLALLGPHL